MFRYLQILVCFFLAHGCSWGASRPAAVIGTTVASACVVGLFAWKLMHPVIRSSKAPLIPVIPVVPPAPVKMIYPLGDGIGSVELLEVAGNDLGIANAARVSLGKMSPVLSDADSKLIAYLIKNSHGTPFEHNMLKFRIKAPIFVTRQWMRHRVGVSYNEISARYAQLPSEMFIPKVWRKQAKSNRQASGEKFDSPSFTDLSDKTCKEAYATYEALIAGGVAREQARIVLPVSMYTEFYFTCNIRSLMHFLNLRLDANAQPEIQEYAKALLALAEPFFPATFKAFRDNKSLPVVVEKLSTTERK